MSLPQHSGPLQPHLSSESTQLIDNLQTYPQRVAHQQQHDAAVRAIEARLRALEAEVIRIRKSNAAEVIRIRKSNALKEQAALQTQKALQNDVCRLLCEGDILIQSYDGTLCPARSSVLIAASAYFSDLLTATGQFMGGEETRHGGQKVITLEATADAVSALMVELHFPGSTDKTSISQTQAFEILQLIAHLGGPRVAEPVNVEQPTTEAATQAQRSSVGTAQATNVSMRNAAAVFTTAFVDSRVEIADAEDCTAFCTALTTAMMQLESIGTAETEAWLAESFREVIAKCAKTIRGMSKSLAVMLGSHRANRFLADLTAAGMVKVLDAAQSAGPSSLHKVLASDAHLVCSWIMMRSTQHSLPTHGNKTSLTLAVCDGSVQARIFIAGASQRPKRRFTRYLHLKLEQHRDKYIQRNIDYLVFLRERANGLLVRSLSPAGLSHRLLALGLSVEGTLDAQRTRLHDAVSIRPLSSDADFVRLWEVVVDTFAKGVNMTELTGIVAFGAMLDPATFSRILSNTWLNVTSEVDVLRCFLKWAEVPGRETHAIDLVAPYIRLPFVSICPPEPDIEASLKSLCARSTVMKALFVEAFSYQMAASRKEEHRFSLKRHAVLEDEEFLVPRNKKRKLCGADTVPNVSEEGIARVLLL